MKLSSLFVPGSSNYIEGNIKDAQVISDGLKNGMQEIAGKAPGQTITGEILEKYGNDLLIAIGKNQFLRAKLDGNMQLELGSQVSFAIKSMVGSKVLLSPLFANTGNDPNVTKALQMAGIPETETSVKMVQTMMKEGLPIDKNSLQQMMRAVNLNPNANLETLTQLTRLHIPISENSIMQLEAYKNYEHQMSHSLLAFSDALSESLNQLQAEGDVKGGIALYKEVLSMLFDGQVSEGEGILQKQENAQMPIAEGKIAATDINPEQVIEKEGILTKAERESLFIQLKQSGFEELADAFSKGEISEKELLMQLNHSLTDKIFLQENRADSLVKMLGGSEIKKLIGDEMINQWMLSPEEVAEENKVEKLYEKLNQQMNRISQALSQSAAAELPLAKAATNVSANIDFMNQLNQMFTYVQLPLKLQGKEANSELYVYTNKKNLAQNEGEVSALLHLDMEHLGSVDVHVKMKDSKVSTRFFLQDDSALDLIAEHIDILNERLEKRGYTMSASFEKKGEEKSVIEEILSQDKNISLLSGYSFDARA